MLIIGLKEPEILMSIFMVPLKYSAWWSSELHREESNIPDPLWVSAASLSGVYHKTMLRTLIDNQLRTFWARGNTTA